MAAAAAASVSSAQVDQDSRGVSKRDSGIRAGASRMVIAWRIQESRPRLPSPAFGGRPAGLGDAKEPWGEQRSDAVLAVAVRTVAFQQVSGETAMNTTSLVVRVMGCVESRKEMG